MNNKIYLEIPKNCPYCGQPTSINIKESNGTRILMCDNPHCTGLLVNKLDHYFGKKGLDVKGISVMVLEQLIDWGWVNSLEDLHNLHKYAEEWQKKNGFGKKSVEKILNSIQEKSNTTLEQFLSAISIPKIGPAYAKDLAKRFKTYSKFREAVNAGFDFASLPNYGPERNDAIISYDFTEADYLVNKYITFKDIPIEENISKSLEGKTIVITGKLGVYSSREALKETIESHGGKVVSAVSSRTDYLINNDVTSTSSKNMEAKKLNVPIISEKEFIHQFLN